MLDNVYVRLLMYPVTFIMGLVPAAFLGFIQLNTATYYLKIDIEGVAMALLIALMANFAIFAKWGLKDTIMSGPLSLTGSYVRLVMYGLTVFVGMLPANIAGAITLDTVNYMLGIDLKALAAAIVAAVGLNVGIFQIFGLKKASIQRR